MLPGAGRFIGMLDDLDIEEYSLDLHGGDRLIMYSDGVVDARNAADERLRIRSVGRGREGSPAGRAPRPSRTIMDSVLTFQGDAPQFDDITLLVAAIE